MPLGPTALLALAAALPGTVLAACSDGGATGGPVTVVDGSPITAAPDAAVTSAGAPPDLAEATVTALPDGTATGEAYRGAVTVTLTATACEGACGPVEIVSGFRHTYCRAGETRMATWELEQVEGHLEIPRLDLSFPMIARGGISEDGSFDLGGAAPHATVPLLSTTRVTGTLSSSDGGRQKWGVTGTARSWVGGTLDNNGGSVDCTMTFEVTPAGR